MELARFLATFKIVGLGEATHGNAKNAAFRVKIIKDMILNHGFRTICIEEDVFAVRSAATSMKNLDIYIHKFLWAWDNRYIYDLFRFVINWNLHHKHDKVTIIGADAQASWALDAVPEDTELGRMYFKYKDEKRPVRDTYLFNLFMKQYDQKSKAIMIFHNGHLSKVRMGDEYMGALMEKHFKEEYFVVANTFTRGTYFGIDWKPGGLSEFGTVSVSVKDPIYGLSKPLFFYPPPSPLMWEGHGGIEIGNPMKYFKKVKTSGYDAILLINDETPLIPYAKNEILLRNKEKHRLKEKKDE
jgi:erythromycin esterase-like protein